MPYKPTSGNIATSNALCLRASLGFGGAWCLWQMAGPGYEAFAFFAAAWAMGGAICAGRLAWHLIQIFLRARKFGDFKRKGVDPKADPMPSEDVLRAKGLTR